MVKACGENSFVIGEHVPTQFWKDAAERLRAKAAITFWQPYVRNPLGPVFIDAGLFLQPSHKFGFVFLLDELQHDFVLLGFIKHEPFDSIAIVFAQDCAGHVAFEFLPFGVFKIELHRTTGFEQRFDLRECAFAVCFQGLDQVVALRERK